MNPSAIDLWPTALPVGPWRCTSKRDDYHTEYYVNTVWLYYNTVFKMHRSQTSLQLDCREQELSSSDKSLCIKLWERNFLTSSFLTCFLKFKSLHNFAKAVNILFNLKSMTRCIIIATKLERCIVPIWLMLLPTN